jgi:hypothetical protein
MICVKYLHQVYGQDEINYFAVWSYRTFQDMIIMIYF